MVNVTVDGLGIRHLSHRFHSDSLQLKKKKIALALTIPPEHLGERNNVMGRRKKRQRDESKELLRSQGILVVE